MIVGSPISTIPYEVLDQITLLLSTKSLLALSLTSRFLSTWTIKYIYHTVKFPCTPGSLKVSKDLHQRLIRDDNLASLVRRLEFGDRGKSNRGRWRNLDYAVPDFLELLKKLSSLEKLTWRVSAPFTIEVANLVAVHYPTLIVVLDYPISIFRNDLFQLQAIRFITNCTLAVDVESFNGVQAAFEALRGFHHLQHLELDFGDFIHLTGFQCQQLNDCLNLVLPRLKYLSISGRLEYDIFLHEPLSPTATASLFVIAPECLLSRLERLEVTDNRTCVGLFRNPTLTGLKYLLCTRPSSETMPDEAEEFQDLLHRNKDLKELHIVDLTSHSDLVSLSPLGTSLHTLDLCKGSYEFGVHQFATLATLLPNLANLSASVEHDATWPYTSLAAVADFFPKIQYLHLRTIEQYICDCCNLVQRSPGECPEDDVIPKIPGTTLDLVSKAWKYFWDVLVSRNTMFLPQGNGPTIHIDIAPRIKSLVLSTEVDYTDDVEVGRSGPSDYCHVFRADRSERLEDFRYGIATVSSCMVEKYETYLRDCALGTEAEDFRCQSKNKYQMMRWIYRKVAEWGNDHSIWPNLRTKDLGSDFGRPRLVVPERTEVEAQYQAANALLERLDLLSLCPRDAQSEAEQGLKG
ncbi:hypothetical protein MMC18_009221 [Xylographa bjoerkii]|nr:hypothetical protein [Xylographa bjoerkii]